VSTNGEAKRPLKEWRTTPNTVTSTEETPFESLGDVTITVPVEYAAVICGALGGMPVDKYLKNGDSLVMSNFFSALTNELAKFGVNYGHPYRSYGEEIIKAKGERPAYMDRKLPS
jgi:hypothetical protein